MVLSGMAIALAFSLPACKKKEEAPREVVRPVKLTTVEAGGGEVRRTFPGKVRATRRVDLAFQVSGPLIELPVKEGEQVRKGRLLARILPRDFETAVSRARAKALEAEQQYQRYRDLYIKKQVSKADFDKYKSQFDIAKAQQKESEDALADTYLRAPFAGVIARRYVENFQDVKAKEPVVSLQDISHLELLVNIPEYLMSSLREGGEHDVIAEFATAPGREFPLKIKEYSTEADPQTQTYQMVLEMPAPEGVNILPGMTANVTGRPPKDVEGAGEGGVMAVPAVAVFSDETGKSLVWVLNEEAMTVHARNVATGELIGADSIQVLDGLEPGERIAVAGVKMLREGMKVRPLEE
jgi:RND family efflux transporter MFP subunit